MAYPTPPATSAALVAFRATGTALAACDGLKTALVGGDEQAARRALAHVHAAFEAWTAARTPATIAPAAAGATK